MDQYSFFKTQAKKAVITTAFALAAMAAFYLAYSEMFAEKQGQNLNPDF